MTAAQFYDLTPIEFDFALQEYNKIQEEREKFELEKMRLQTLYLVNVHLKNTINDVRKLMPFTWDKFEVYVPTEIEWDELQKLADKIWQKQSQN